jgi:hypothetical protein
MNKFLLGFCLGFIVALITTVVSFLLAQRVFNIIPPFAESSSETATEAGGECSNINPDVGEFGGLKVTLLHQGSAAKNVEVDLAITPGPDNYCSQITDENGVVEFGKVPVGNYYIYLNMNNFPEEYGIPSAEEQVTIEEDSTLEVTLELTDYQK